MKTPTPTFVGVGVDYVDAVDKIEGKDKPEGFIGYRNRSAAQACFKDRPTTYMFIIIF